MFVSSDRTRSPRELTPLTSANVLPLVAANDPEPTTAVTSCEHRPASSHLGAVGCGEHWRSVPTNEINPEGAVARLSMLSPARGSLNARPS